MKPSPQVPSRYSRRDFVSLLAAAGAALPLSAATAGAQSSSRGRSSRGGASRLGTLHVFSKPLQWMSYEDTAELIAEAGCGGIDYTVRPRGQVLPERVQDDLPRAVEAAKKAGLKVEMITTAITDPRDRHTEPLLRTAAKLGVKVYRYGNFRYDLELGVWESLQKTKAELKELAAMNRDLGLHGAIQNHAGARVGGPLWDLYELLRDLDPRWSGVQYDIRHAVVEGAQSWPLSLRLLAPWIKCTDYKDFVFQQSPGKAVIKNVPLGEGVVPFDAYFNLQRELKIGGPMSLHLEYPPFEHAEEELGEAEKRRVFLAAMKKDVAFLRRHIGA